MAQSLTIMVSCHNFQQRLCWMLSSIVEQRDDKIPNITIDIAHMANNGDPTCEDLASFFMHKYGLDITLTTYEDTKELQYRGLVRNRQLQKCKTDWVLFADCDIVFTDTFWPALKLFMDKHNEDLMFHLGRYSCDREQSDRVISKFSYPCYVHGSAVMCAAMTLREMRNVGAGYFQLVRKRIVDTECGGIYVDPVANKDYSWDRIQKAKSDQQFRRRINHRPILLNELIENEFFTKIADKREKTHGEKKLLQTDMPFIYHLNHIRDNEVGHHIELQR